MMWKRVKGARLAVIAFLMILLAGYGPRDPPTTTRRRLHAYGFPRK
jgi:hypothetical protein